MKRFTSKQQSLFIIYILLISMVLINGSIVAEENGSFHQEEQEEGVYADRITVASGEALAEGNALIIYQGLWIKADTIRYYLETTEIIVSGNVHFNNGEYQLWAEKMEGNLQDELVLTGNSRLSY